MESGKVKYVILKTINQLINRLKEIKWGDSDQK